MFDQMVLIGYGREDSVFRRVFTSLMIPGATEEQMRWLDDLQRVATSAENAYAARLDAPWRTPVTCSPASTCPRSCCTAAATR